MSLKLRTIFILYLMLLSGVLSYDVINKYGSKKTDVNSVFLDVSGFNVDEKIYITLTVYQKCSSSILKYKFYKNTEDYNSIDSLSSTYSSSTTYDSLSSDYKEKYYFEFEKSSSDYKYLFMQSDCSPPLNFENTKKDGDDSMIIVIVVCAIVGVTLLIIIIVCTYRRCKRRYAAVPYPMAPVYGVSPYSAQPMGMGMMQPVMNVQPYGVNTVNPNYPQIPNVKQKYSQTYNNQSSKYDLINRNPPGSDLRLNQETKIEKPK